MDNIVLKAEIKRKLDPAYIFFFMVIDLGIWFGLCMILDEMYVWLLAVLAVLTVILLAFVSSGVGKCYLQLTDKTIEGKVSTANSKRSLLLPLDKVDSIMKESTMTDRILSGETVAVRSASGVIRFPCVHNADEFVGTALEMIEKYKHSAAAGPGGEDKTDLEELRKLKELLDMGAVTQEEFDAKKKELLRL
ncbi:MAG: SHOCT domain-containing protein [Ruminococcus sp.]|nr:SHOCT domain-containing protein [Ruminococcus sp.]